MTENLNHSYLNQSGLERYTEKLKDYLKDNYVSKEDKIVANDLTEFNSIEKEYTFVSKIANDGEEFRDNSAEITKIKGNTLIYNQLLKHINRKDEKNGLVFEQDGYGRVSVKGTATVDTAIDIGRAQLKTGHVYAFYGIDSETSSFIPDTMRWGDQDQGNDTGNGSISTISYPNENRFCVLYVKAGVKLDYFFYPKVTDLTQMFGVGNEPTTMEEFYNNTKLIHKASDYNPGQFINGNYKGIKTLSPNVWNEQWQLGYYNINTGKYVTTNRQICTKNQIQVLPNTKYYGYAPDSIWVLFYDIQDNYTGRYELVNNSEFETNSTDYFVRFYTLNTYGDTYKNNICISVSNPNINGSYVPYKENFYDLKTNDLYEGGMKSIIGADVKDEIDFTKDIAYDRIDSKKLNDLSITISQPTEGYPSGVLTCHGLEGNTNDYNCDIYEVVDQPTENGIYLDSDNNLNIINTNITDLNTLVKGGIPDNEIWYVTRDNRKVEIGSSSPITNGNLIDNVYSNGFGRMIFDVPITIMYSIAKYTAFDNRIKFIQIILPKTITEIGDYAFSGMESLENINIPEGVTRIDESAFNGCYSLERIILPESITEIGASAFHSIRSLEIINIPQNLIGISHDMFYGCEKLIFVDLPSTTKYIGAYAFKGCKELTSITIPEAVEEIQQEAFYWCDNLTDVYCYPTVPPARILNTSVIEEEKSEGDANIEPLDETTNSDVVKIFGESGDTKVNIWVPYESVDLYKEAWPDYADQIFPGFNIPNNIIYYKSNSNQMIDIIDHIDIDKEDGTQISISAFGGAKIINHTYENGLGKLEFDGDVISIGFGNSLSDLYDHSSGEYLYVGFFKNKSISDIVLPSTICDGGRLLSSAFDNCEKLHNIIFNLPYNSFNEDMIAKTIYITNDAWPGCKNLCNFCTNYTNIHWNIGIIKGLGSEKWGTSLGIKYLISNKMFGHFDGSLMDNVNMNAFFACLASLKYIRGDFGFVKTYGQGTNLLPEHFSNCRSLKYVDLPFIDKQSVGYVLYIPWGTFKDCSSLKYVNNLNSDNKIAYIGKQAFANCPIYGDLVFNSFHDNAYGDIIPDIVINAFFVPNSVDTVKDFSNRIVLEVDPNTFNNSNAGVSYNGSELYPSIYIKCNEAFKMGSSSSYRSFYRHLYIPKNLYEEFKTLNADSDWRKYIKTWDQYSDLLPSLIKIDGSIQYAKKEEEERDIADISEFPFIKTWVGGEESLQANDWGSAQSAPIVMSMIYNYRAKSRLDKISKFIAAPISPKMVDHILSECLSTSYNGSGPGWNGLFGDFED